MENRNTEGNFRGNLSKKISGMNSLVFMSVFLVLFIASFFSASLFMQRNNSEASEVEVSAVILPVITVSTPSTCNLGALSVSTQALAYCNLTSTVSTNNPTGYKLIMNTAEEISTSNGNTCLRHSTVSTTNCASVAAGKKFTSVGNNVAVASMGANTWGASVDNSGSPTYANYNTIPAFNLTGLTLRNSAAQVSGENTTTRIGAKGNVSLAVGAYSGVVTITATANVRPNPLVSSISPSSGPAGTEITLTGTNMNLLYQVKIGGEICTGLTILSATSAKCATPLTGVADGAQNITTISVYGDNSAQTPKFTQAVPLRGLRHIQVGDNLSGRELYFSFPDNYVFPVGSQLLCDPSGHNICIDVGSVADGDGMDWVQIVTEEPWINARIYSRPSGNVMATTNLSSVQMPVAADQIVHHSMLGSDALNYIWISNNPADSFRHILPGDTLIGGSRVDIKIYFSINNDSKVVDNPLTPMVSGAYEATIADVYTPSTGATCPASAYSYGVWWQEGPILGIGNDQPVYGNSGYFGSPSTPPNFFRPNINYGVIYQYPMDVAETIVCRVFPSVFGYKLAWVVVE